MDRNIIIAILGICIAAGIVIGVTNLPQTPDVITPVPIVDNNETEVIVIENNTDIVDNSTVDNQTVVPDEEFKHNFSKFTLLK